MDPLVDFALRMSAFMAFFLCISYYLMRHIQKVRAKYGNPKDTQNKMMILKHFFTKHSDH